MASRNRTMRWYPIRVTWPAGSGQKTRHSMRMRARSLRTTPLRGYASARVQRTPENRTIGLLGATGVGVGAIVGGGILVLGGVAFALDWAERDHRVRGERPDRGAHGAELRGDVDGVSASRAARTRSPRRCCRCARRSRSGGSSGSHTSSRACSTRSDSRRSRPTCSRISPPRSPARRPHGSWPRPFVLTLALLSHGDLRGTPHQERRRRRTLGDDRQGRRVRVPDLGGHRRAVRTVAAHDRARAHSVLPVRCDRPPVRDGHSRSSRFRASTSIAAVAGEVKRPERTIPRAMLYSLGAALAIYLPLLFLVSTVGTSGGESVVTLSTQHPDTFMAVAVENYLGPAGYWLVMVAAVLSTLSALQANLLAASRVALTMAQDRTLPLRTDPHAPTSAARRSWRSTRARWPCARSS